MKKNIWFAYFSLLAVFLACSVFIIGQETRGAIRGLVLDPNGSPVSGAKVTVSDPSRGTSISINSNSDGFYQVNYLLSGKYSIAVEMNGFKKLQRENVVVEIGNTIQVDLPLEIGGAQETVTVTADLQQLNTENGSVSQTIDAKRMADLPLSKGDPYKLIGTSTGVTYTGSARLDRPFEPTHIVGYAIDGTRGNRSDLTIDGAPSTSTANGNEVIASYVPPSDIIQEFKVQTATFDAQFGNTEGGVTSISIKSGTNSLHGSGYYFGEPIQLASNDVFGKARNQPIVSTVSRRFGGSINGPVRFPWLYNGKDKTFFLFGWESIRDTRPRFDAAATSWVPTAKMRAGDFSDYLPANCASPGAGQVCLYNPFNRTTANNNTGTVFAGNIIPDALISPVAKKILGFYSLPKQSGLIGNIADSTLTEKTRKYDNWTFRIDQNISKNNRMFVRGSWYDRDSFYNDYMGTAATGNVFGFRSRQGIIDDVHVFDASTVLNVRYGYNRFIRIGEQREEAQGFDLTSLGFSTEYNNAIPVDIRRFPRFDFSGGMISTGFGNELRPTTTHAPAITLNKTWNTHSMKFGAELRVYREDDSFASNDQTGQFIFDNTYTKQSTASFTDVNGLQGFASFLLGLPTTVRIVRRADYSEYSKTYGFFFQDDWKVTKNLTLNMGLRYEKETPLIERQNKSIAGFDQNYVHQSIQDQARANLTANPISVNVTGTSAISINPATFNVKGALIFANEANPGLYSTPNNTWLPRFGAAYQLNDKTVIRGGFGMFAGFLGERRGDVIQPGYTRTTELATTLTAGGSTIPANMADAFKNPAVILEPVGNAQGVLTGLGSAISFFNPNPRVSKQMRYQIGLQRQLPWGVYLDLMYVGNYGYDIEIARNINAVPLQYLNGDNSRTAAMTANDTKLRLNAACNTATCVGTFRNPFTGISLNGVNPFLGTSFVNATGSVALSQLLRPFPAFGDINTTVNDGKSWYNSAQIVLSKRLARGFQGQLAYTFSKWIQATEYLNAADALPTKMISDQDVPHRLAMNFTYQLPFGKGAAFGSDASGLTNALIGGWQITGVYQYQAGFPIAFGTDLFYNGGDIAINSTNTTAWFNTSVFTSVINNTSTNSTPVSHIRTLPTRFSDVRRDSINNVDLSLLKDVRFSESMKLRFTFEVFNAFNQPYLPAPGTNPTSAVVLTTPVASGFGTVSGATQDNYARRVQLGIKFVF
jgi:hypothetical protein